MRCAGSIAAAVPALRWRAARAERGRPRRATASERRRRAPSLRATAPAPASGPRSAPPREAVPPEPAAPRPVPGRGRRRDRPRRPDARGADARAGAARRRRLAGPGAGAGRVRDAIHQLGRAGRHRPAAGARPGERRAGALGDAAGRGRRPPPTTCSGGAASPTRAWSSRSPRSPAGGIEYIVVTRERTTATNTIAYRGLAAEWHVAVATVTRTRGGLWVLSDWQPES